MNSFVVDTSVTVAWYVPEVFSPSAREWQDRMLSGRVRFIVPALHYWEFANVLRTLAVRGTIDEELAADIFDIHLDAPLETQEPMRRDVLRTALAYSATVYDAVYITLAEVNEMPLITAERSTTGWVAKLGDLAELVR